MFCGSVSVQRPDSVVAQVVSLCSVLPLIMFLSFQVCQVSPSAGLNGCEQTQLTCAHSFPQDEFETLNPLVPTHYLYLCRRFYRAVQENNFKVSRSRL